MGYNKRINYMKKRMLLFTLILLGFFTIANAQVCKISNSNDNVEVFSANIIDGLRVEVTVGNDSQDISANVTVEVEVTYNYGNLSDKKTFTGKKVAKPNAETIINIPIDKSYPNSKYTPSSVRVTGISGTKCIN